LELNLTKRYTIIKMYVNIYISFRWDKLEYGNLKLRLAGYEVGSYFYRT